MDDAASLSLYPARLWRPFESGSALARCFLCAHSCLIAPGKAGLCGVRLNKGGKLFSLVGRALAAVNLDPVEKKPLFHFLPGTRTFSIGSLGCNFRCAFCQNSDISQVGENGQEVFARLKAVTPEEIVQAALNSGAESISYTYNEPTVFFELMQDCAALAKEAGLKNIMVSNAYMSEACFNELRPLMHAANFDLKAFSGSFYRKHCGARLEPVLETIRRAAEAGWWIELTTLLIPGENDSPEELESLAAFIFKELGPDVPWHISRFHPAYQMLNTAPTPTSLLEKVLGIGNKAGLRFVYAGNIPGHASENTLCPACGALCVPRYGYRLAEGWAAKCPDCGFELPGVWK